jgi:hypothetical protein
LALHQINQLGGMKPTTPLWLFAAAMALAAFAPTPATSPANSTSVLRSMSFRDDFESGRLDAWQMPFPEDWEIVKEGGDRFLHMKRSREPGVPRRPLQFALLRKVNVGTFNFQSRVRRDGRSMIIVFNYVDTLHFYYAHLSEDRGTVQPVHNGIFIVDGGPRRRIAGAEADSALPDRNWHQVQVARDTRSGWIEVFIDGASRPLFSVVDRTFTCGQVGIGSFDETGDFEDIHLESDEADCVPGRLLIPAKIE